MGMLARTRDRGMNPFFAGAQIVTKQIAPRGSNPRRNSRLTGSNRDSGTESIKMRNATAAGE